MKQNLIDSVLQKWRIKTVCELQTVSELYPPYLPLNLRNTCRHIDYLTYRLTFFLLLLNLPVSSLVFYIVSCYADRIGLIRFRRVTVWISIKLHIKQQFRRKKETLKNEEGGTKFNVKNWVGFKSFVNTSKLVFLQLLPPWWQGHLPSAQQIELFWLRWTHTPNSVF